MILNLLTSEVRFFGIEDFASRLNSFLSAWAILVCYSRSYLGVHYPGDLFVGMLLGLTGAILAYLLFAYVTGEKPKKEIKHGYLPVIVVSVTFAGIIITSFFYHF